MNVYVGSAGASGFAVDEPEFASWGSRVGAALVDAVVVFALVVAGAIVGGVLQNPVLAILLAVSAYGAYFVIGHGSESGQTLGKKAFSIAVVSDPDGDCIGYGGALWRLLAYLILGVIPLVSLLDLLAPLWDGKNQTWHDKLADTVVVRV